MAAQRRCPIVPAPSGAIAAATAIPMITRAMLLDISSLLTIFRSPRPLVAAGVHAEATQPPQPKLLVRP
jgi:hypothetical protein